MGVEYDPALLTQAVTRTVIGISVVVAIWIAASYGSLVDVRKSQRVLYGLQKSKRALINKHSAIVCEGQLDLITAFEAGVENVIAPQGTAFTAEHARILKRYVDEVVLCFDSDTAGQNAAEKSLPSLLAQNLSVRVAEMPLGHDPDSLIREEGAEAFIERIANAKDFFEFKIEKGASDPEVQSPRGKLQFSKKMAEFVSLITDPVFRDSLVNTLCSRLAISPKDFRAMLTSASKFKREPDPQEEQNPAPAPLQLSKTMALLCQLALTDVQARSWLLGRNWREFFSKIQDAELLLKILGGTFSIAEVNSVNAFISSLSDTEAPFVSALLLDKAPLDSMVVVQDCWRALEQRELKRRMEIIGARLRQPNLPAEELQELQAEYKTLLTSK